MNPTNQYGSMCLMADTNQKTKKRSSTEKEKQICSHLVEQVKMESDSAEVFGRTVCREKQAWSVSLPAGSLACSQKQKTIVREPP